MPSFPHKFSSLLSLFALLPTHLHLCLYTLSPAEENFFGCSRVIWFTAWLPCLLPLFLAGRAIYFPQEVLSLRWENRFSGQEPPERQSQAWRKKSNVLFDGGIVHFKAPLDLHEPHTHLPHFMILTQECHYPSGLVHCLPIEDRMWCSPTEC